MDYNDFEQELRNMQANDQQPSQSSSRDDVDMAHDDNDDLPPPLEPIPGSDSAPQAVEVEMQTAVDDPSVPEVDVAASSQPRPNRRARVEDDDDEDRDRRHPSERIITPLPSFSMSPTPSQPDLASFFDALGAPPSAPAGPSTTSTTPNAPPPSTNNNIPPPPPNLPEFMTGGIAISFDIGPGFPGGEPPAEGAAPFPGFSADTLRDMFGIEPDVEDPERAERLIKGLEEVPVGLVRRLERVGGMTGANGEDLSGGDSGCAVCWEKLLDQDDQAEEKERPKIVALPCAHVFHADCLRPWFSRPKHTTCPTCRFNIDPEDLTYVPYRQRRRTQEQQQQAASPSAQPAQAAPAGNPVPGPAEPDPAQGASTSTTSAVESEDARGRPGPNPVPDAVPGATRRTNSEPPTNRPPRPAQRPDMIQSFPVPGGHVVVVNHPLGIFSDAQGRPAASATGQQEPQETPRAPTPAAAATGTATDEAPQPSATPAGAQVPHPPQPTPPPAPGANPYNAIPRMTMPGGGQLPPGVVAFDIHLPFPIPFPPPGAQAGPQQANATLQATPTPAQGQPFRPPGTGFAGINFGQGGGPVDIPDIMRRMFGGVPMPAPSANAAAPANNAAALTSANTPPPNANTSPTANANAPPTANANPTPTVTANPAPPVDPASSTPAAGSPPAPQANADAQGQQPGDLAIEIENLLRGYLNNPGVMFRLLMSAALSGAIPVGAMPGGRPQTRTDPNAPKRQWTPPAAPGPTLRQRVEKREREAGLRCFDISCGVGPSDEDPFVALSDALKKRCSIQSKDASGDAKVCSHTFHSSCLVSAERVALRGADAAVVDGQVEVSCPVCRGAGVISKVDWDDGVMQLA